MQISAGKGETTVEPIIELVRPPTWDPLIRTVIASIRNWGDFFHQQHTKKDDKDVWCKEKGYNIENIAGDGNCLYASLGRSRKLSGKKVRQILLGKS
eukprot:3934192-Heterocapsa_arctica.AAC.1